MTQRSASCRSIFGALIAAGMTFLVFGMFLVQQHYSLFGCTKSNNVFVYLAWSFIHGRLDIECSSPDLSVYHDRGYAYWPPLAAFLLMPFVYFRGPYIGDKWLNVLLVAISAGAGWLITEALAEKRNLHVSLWYKILLTVFLSCGTGFLTLALTGTQYYMAGVAGTTMMLLALLSLLKIQRSWQFSITGIFWSLGILSRIHFVLAAPLFIYCALYAPQNFKSSTGTKPQNIREKLKNLGYLIIPVVLVILFFAWYNWERFGSIFETGISYHQMCSRFQHDFNTYGYISLHYLWNNVYFTLLRIPLFEHQSWFQEPTLYTDWREGYSLFFQSPVLIYSLMSLRIVRRDAFVAALWLSIILVATPVLCLMGTGWKQFGARYLFDLFPFLFPLTIIGSNGKTTLLFVLAVIASVSINIWGLNLLLNQPL